jgi:hypothetical protein
MSLWQFVALEFCFLPAVVLQKYSSSVFVPLEHSIDFSFAVYCTCTLGYRKQEERYGRTVILTDERCAVVSGISTATRTASLRTPYRTTDSSSLSI